ncbi:DUF6778 family protein [Paracoccus pacificus]|uniref:DUF6778 family protein n=1 Tax=Paracoccus pacificus TaxID=1463598 RepID=A0ABW4R2V7_9RHOB
MIKSVLLGGLVVAGLAGCAVRSDWRTEYQQIPASQSANWKVTGVNVVAPATLTTTEENSYVPEADVVWHGDPPGDRRAQAAAIVTEGIRAGSAGLRGRTPVTIAATVTQFHALTPLTRGTNFANAGVENISYTVQVLDARSGAPLTQPQLIEADFPGLTGSAAVAADAAGNTERRQIVNHIAVVTQNWLGSGPDPRGGFNRMGR